MVTPSDPFTDNCWGMRNSGRLLVYIGPHLADDLDRGEVQALLRRCRAYAALWSYDWDCGEDGPWYSVICDKPDYDLGTIRSGNTRRKIRRCLKCCEMRRVDPAWMAENGFEVHAKAVTRYKNGELPSRADFSTSMRSLVGRPDVEILGVFAGRTIVAYGVAVTVGESVRVGYTQFDPEHSSVMPMYGLFYTIARYYLQKGYRFVDNGSRPLMHETSVDEFLERMGWRKAFCRLGLEMLPTFRTALYGLRRARRWSGPLWSSKYLAILDGLLLAEDIARETTKRSGCPPGRFFGDSKGNMDT
jgi:hypothetical protein